MKDEILPYAWENLVLWFSCQTHSMKWDFLNFHTINRSKNKRYFRINTHIQMGTQIHPFICIFVLRYCVHMCTCVCVSIYVHFWPGAELLGKKGIPVSIRMTGYETLAIIHWSCYKCIKAIFTWLQSPIALFTIPGSLITINII